MLRIATWNVLAPEYSVNTSFYNTVREFLPWEVRWPRIAAHVRTLGADVLCLQEVSIPTWETHWLPLAAELGMDAWIAAAEDRRPAVAVLVGHKWRAEPLACGKPGHRKRPTARAALALDGARLAIASVHFRYTPSGRRSMRELASELRSLSALGPDIAVVAGDINADVWRHERWDRVAALDARVAHAGCHGSTFAAAGRAQILDAIVVRGTCGVRAEPYAELRADNPMPNAEWPSDHVPLVATLSRR